MKTARLGIGLVVVMVLLNGSAAIISEVLPCQVAHCRAHPPRLVASVTLFFCLGLWSSSFWTAAELAGFFMTVLGLLCLQMR